MNEGQSQRECEMHSDRAGMSERGRRESCALTRAEISALGKSRNADGSKLAHI